jgi:hypothetical protein
VSLDQLPGVTAQRPEVGAAVTASWDDTTVADTAATVTTTNMQQVVGTLDLDGTSISTGLLQFEASWDGGTTWVMIGAFITTDWNTQSPVIIHYLDLATVDPNNPFALAIPCVGATHARVRLATALTGTTPTADLRLIPTTAPFAPLAHPVLLAVSAGFGDLTYLTADGSGRLLVASPAGSQADGHSATLGLTTDSESPSGNAGVISLLKRLRTLLAGGLPVALGAGGGLKVDGSGTALPVSVATIPSHAVTNAGAFATQVDGAALTALQLIDDTVFTDDAGFTPGTSKISVIGMQADEASIDSVDEGDAGAPRMTLDRKTIVTPQPHALGGLSIFRSIDLDEGTLEVVKNSPGCVYGMWVTNTATATRWIKFYDATSGTYGTGTPVITIGIPGNSTDDIAGNFGPGGMGIQFATGICVGAGTGFADADTGAPGANDVIVNIFYK